MHRHFTTHMDTLLFNIDFRTNEGPLGQCRPLGAWHGRPLRGSGRPLRGSTTAAGPFGAVVGPFGAAWEQVLIKTTWGQVSDAHVYFRQVYAAVKVLRLSVHSADTKSLYFREDESDATKKLMFNEDFIADLCKQRGIFTIGRSSCQMQQGCPRGSTAPSPHANGATLGSRTQKPHIRPALRLLYMGYI